MKKSKIQKRNIRHKRVRSKISGTKDVPRLSVFRSNKFIYAQLIDDVNGKTLASASDIDIKEGKMTKSQRAEKVGEKLAEEAKTKKIEKVVFDRGGFSYAGRIKILSEGARNKGLKF